MSNPFLPKNIISEPNFTFNFENCGSISAVHFSSYQLTQDVLLVAFSTKILLAKLLFGDNIELQQLAEISSGITCNTLALSPATLISTESPTFLFCAAGNDFNIRFFKSNLAEDTTCKIVNAHSDYINELSYDPDNTFLASVSDDNTAKIWNTSDYSNVATLHLGSAGMSVCWHKEDPSKLMVAEKIGIIRFYNVNTQKPILSLDFGKPLSSAHWGPSDSQLVCSLHLGELALWDLAKPSCPSHVSLMQATAGGYVRLSSHGELVAIVNPMEGYLRVLLVSNQQQRLGIPILFPTNCTWHCRLPIMCIGNDKKLCIWKLAPK